MNKQEQEVLKDLENKSQAWARIILRLIDKLQKENEELKENNKIFEELKDELKPLVLDEYISKDKIRTKIKELEELFDKNEKETTIQYQNQFIVDVVGVLEELLGETKDEE